MTFPLTQAAAQETAPFESLNEGIWLPEAALQNIETAFANSEETFATLTNACDTTALQVQVIQNDLATANDTIAERDATIAQLQTELAAAKVAPAGEFENTSRDRDDAGAVKEPFHLSDQDPANQIADSLFGKPKTTKP